MTKPLVGYKRILCIGCFLLGLLASPTGLWAQTSQSRDQSINVPNPATDLWRNVRNRAGEEFQPIDRNSSPKDLLSGLWGEMRGKTQDSGGAIGTELINSKGELWRNYRMNQLAPFAGYLLGGMVLFILAFFLIRGRLKVTGGNSGLKILRFTMSQRTVHWIVAITFLTLGLSGIILVLGRELLIPLLGAKGFSMLATVTRTVHNYTGPIFGVALLIQFVLFVRGNFPAFKVDFKWLLKGGGMFGGHVSSNCYNAGEKIWFWIAMLGGLLVVATGLVLDFPIFGQDRATMGFMHILHSISAVLILAVSFGHIYMATAGTENTFGNMKTGYCDANWAKEHHDLWYEKMKSAGKIVAADDRDSKAERSDAEINTSNA